MGGLAIVKWNIKKKLGMSLGSGKITLRA
jgi:hypothetical protein